MRLSGKLISGLAVTTIRVPAGVFTVGAEAAQQRGNGKGGQR